MSERTKVEPWLTASAGNLAVRISTLLTGVVLARSFGPTGRGLIAIAMLWPGAMLSFGTVVNAQASTYFVSRFGWGGVRTCIRWAAINGAVLLLAALTLNWLLVRATREKLWSAANVYALVIPLTIVASVLNGALLAMGKLGTYWVSRFATTGTTLAIVGALALSARLSVHSYMWALVLGLPVGMVAALRGISLWQLADGKVPTGAAVLTFGSKIVGTLLPVQVNFRIDQILLALLVTTSDIGEYAVAVTWSSVVSVIGTGFASVVQSKAVRLDAGDVESMFDAMADLRLATIILGLVAGAAMMAAPLALPFVFGRTFAPAVGTAVLLCAATLLLNAKLLLRDFARGLGHPALPLAAETVGAIVRVPLLLLLLPALGAAGAAITAIACNALVLAFIYRRMARDIPHLTAAEMIPRLSDIVTLGQLGRRIALRSISRVRH